MNEYLWGLWASVLLPLMPMAQSLFLLRRAIRPKKAHWFSLAASGMVFTFSALWLTKALGQLLEIANSAVELRKDAWASANLAHGPYMATTLLLLSVGFWGWLVWQGRRSGK
jgi:hypothetical protein